MAIVTLDLGTSYLKATLFDASGRIFALHRAPLRASTEQGWELAPARLQAMIVAALADLKTSVPDAWPQVAAISFATQTNSFLLLDRADRPLTPIILWPDSRAAGAPDLVARFSEAPGLHERTGLAELSAGFMLPKLAWLQRERPQVWSRTARLALLSDFITLWLTGQHVTEAGTAGLTGLVDVNTLTWWPEQCERAALSPEQLPLIVRAGSDLGPIRSEIAAELGLPPACRFVVGCLDQYAGAIGTGNVLAGGLSETTGTVLASIRCAAEVQPQAATGVFQGPGFAPSVVFQMCFGSTSANLLEMFRESLHERTSFEALGDAAAHVPAGCEGLRARLDETTQRVTFNRTPQTTAHGARAIMEAVAAALRGQVHRLCVSALPKRIVSAGGAARSALWLQIKADMLGVPLAATLCPEPTSLGAAILAASGIGRRSVTDLAGRWVRTGTVHEPDPGRYRVYQEQVASGENA